MYKSHDFVSDFLSLDDDLVEWNPDKVAPHVQEAYALITHAQRDSLLIR